MNDSTLVAITVVVISFILGVFFAHTLIISGFIR